MKKKKKFYQRRIPSEQVQLQFGRDGYTPDSSLV
jgi:hypothetical protein